MQFTHTHWQAGKFDSQVKQTTTTTKNPTFIAAEWYHLASKSPDDITETK